MYKVVLLHKKTGEVSGDIGTYDDLDEANSQANDYNRKGDRHIGHAVVQAEIGNESPSQSRRGLKLNQNPQNTFRSQPQQRFSRTVVDEPSEEEELSSEELSIDSEESLEEESLEDSMEELLQQSSKIPHWHQQQIEIPKEKKFAFLIDTYTGKGIVLEQNRFLNNFLLANPTYTIQNTGEIHNMIFERNKYLQSRKR